MGLFDFLNRGHKSEAIMPEPGTPEFEATVAGSALPGSSGSLGVEPDQWQSVKAGRERTVEPGGPAGEGPAEDGPRN